MKKIFIVLFILCSNILVGQPLCNQSRGEFYGRS